jgi:hypothetical protein
MMEAMRKLTTRMSEDRLAAQDDMLAAMMTPSNAVN